MAARPRIPNYDLLLEEFTMKTFKGEYPATWKHHIAPAKEPKEASGSAKAKTSQPEDNRQPDTVLQKRYQDSGSLALTPMMGDLIKQVPKADKDAICLAWALQGKCCTGCDRKSNHRQLSAAIMSTLHDFLEKCPGITASRQ